MSTVILDTITGKSTATTITIGSTPVVSASANSMTIRGEGSNQTSIQQGLGKVWINATDAAALSDSLNVSSGTDVGTGDYSYSLSNNMGNNQYSQTNNTLHAELATAESQTLLTTEIHVIVFTRMDSFSKADVRNMTTVHGDLA